MRSVRLVDPERDIGSSKFGVQAKTVYQLLQAAAVDGIVQNPLDVVKMLHFVIAAGQFSTVQEPKNVYRSSVSKLIDSGWITYA